MFSSFIGLSIILIVSAISAVTVLHSFFSLRAWKKEKNARSDQKTPVLPPVNRDRAVEKLRHILCIPSVSSPDPDKMPWDAFEAIHEALSRDYPHVHAKMTVTKMDGSLIFHMKGTDPSILPALLLSHLDVVPAGNEKLWIHPPFAGEIADGYVWGRGSFDIKEQVTAIMEAWEILLEGGFVPARSWYIAFGCDEEISGHHGAQRISQMFAEKKLRFSLVLDEGGAVVENYMPGLSRPVAAVGIAEKGFLNVTLSTQRDGGHSSTPRNPSAVGVIARAVERLDFHKDHHHWTNPVVSMLRILGLQSSFPYSFLFINNRIFRPLLTYVFSHSPGTDALIRTTHAATMFTGSQAANVIPPSTSAVINYRLLPGDTKGKILERIRRRIADDSIILDTDNYSPPTTISPVDGDAFRTLQDAISRVFPDAAITPYLAQGAADARYYQVVSDAIYRFTPVQLDTSEVSRMHNYDERLSVENMEKAVCFFLDLIQRW
ncbi:M20/M25/M40 family metallo-hydrolase [Parasphaerochaeta coccoides]|uniref:Gly-Xaa carboxypeptidase n=1 Tax=Parasphaerochaeta coccoides (strain ATCC BAA-1237 / DSM 17374 / SPN1) TaxID=760011 RepID=F4GKR1_PARC1|nr:M20/M25/M40 family metallo-hydrolase [Parasphaerochaeta coccoides]AEC01470.1 Gly-Xaa carboxypeptidase [Parasphaerochaeta coccoides DSM 17374]